MERIIIIGGGIIGEFCAYYLSQHFDDISIIDEQPAAPPASMGNCGLITPSHLVPFNQWSFVLQGIKWLGKKDAPLAIRPQFSFDFIRWFYSFLAHCNGPSQEKTTRTLHRLLQRSYDLYSEFFEKETIDANWQQKGILYVCKTAKGLKEIKREKEYLDRHQLPNQLFTREELLAIEPTLSDDILGGALFNCDGWLNPAKLIVSLKYLNKSKGIKHIDATALSFAKRGKHIDHVNTSSGSLKSDLYLLCGGAKSVNLLRKLGIHIPIIPAKGYNLTVNSTLPLQPSRPVYMVERKVVATPWTDGFRLGSTLEFSGFNLDLNKTRLNALLTASSEYLKTNTQDASFTPWAGLRPMSSSGIPAIKRSSYGNLLIAVGHGMLGLSTAPATGELITKIAMHET